MTIETDGQGAVMVAIGAWALFVDDTGTHAFWTCGGRFWRDVVVGRA